MRVSRQATIFWGDRADRRRDRRAVACTRSVLDAGLAVLSLAAGPVLGAFLVGVLTTRVGTHAMLTGMLDRRGGPRLGLGHRRDRVDLVRADRLRR